MVYHLTDRDQIKVGKALTKAINRGKGIEDDSEDEAEEEEDEDEEKAPKKKKESTCASISNYNFLITQASSSLVDEWLHHYLKHSGDN